MAAVYLAFGLGVERFSRDPQSRLRVFARTLCAPIARPVARLLPPGASERRVLATSLVAVAVLWAVLVAVDTALRRG